MICRYARRMPTNITIQHHVGRVALTNFTGYYLKCLLSVNCKTGLTEFFTVIRFF